MKPKVLYLMHMPPPIHGAALVGQQIKESYIINDNFEGNFINIGLAANISDIGRYGMKKFISYFKLLISVYKTLKKDKYDICYITPTAKGSAFLKDFLLIKLVKSFKVKILLHFHNKGVSKYQDKTLYNFLYKQFFKDTKVILLAESLYFDIKKYVKEVDVYYSYVGISPFINKEHKEKPNELIQFVFLSNLIIEKGIIVALEACSILKKKGFDFNFIFAGGTSFEMSASQFNILIESYKLQDKVKYIGRISDEEKNILLAESDVFVFPTYYHNECFPAVILEAMKNSLAVISTYEGAIPSEVTDGETGFLCKQKDVLDLVTKMEILINNPNLAISLGKNGKAIFNNKFTSDKFELKICNIFKETLF